MSANESFCCYCHLSERVHWPHDDGEVLLVLLSPRAYTHTHTQWGTGDRCQHLKMKRMTRGTNRTRELTAWFDVSGNYVMNNQFQSNLFGEGTTSSHSSGLVFMGRLYSDKVLAQASSEDCATRCVRSQHGSKIRVLKSFQFGSKMSKLPKKAKFGILVRRQTGAALK